jgi:3-oxoacyl-[acyl-carrier protein] reductase
MTELSRRELIAAAAASPLAGAAREKGMKKTHSGLLEGKVAVIYGAAGSIGSTVARTFAREGAHVELAGRTAAKVEALAADIEREGGSTAAAKVDALDRESVESHLEAMMRRRGRLDIAFNLISIDDVQGFELVEMNVDTFSKPVTLAMHTQFLTSTAAARRMMPRRSGVILMLTAQVARKPAPTSGGFGVACAAIEGLCRQFAIELGPSGVRVVTLRSSGSPDAPGVLAAIADHAKAAGVTLEEFKGGLGKNSMLRRMPQMAEVANAAVLMASDRASAITAAVTNVTCGEIAD